MIVWMLACAPVLDVSGNPHDPEDDWDGDGADEDHGDCDDTDASVFPSAIWYADRDGDTYGDTGHTLTACEPPAGFVAPREDGLFDCNDDNVAIHPCATEVCGNGVVEVCGQDGACLSRLGDQALRLNGGGSAGSTIATLPGGGAVVGSLSGGAAWVLADVPSGEGFLQLDDVGVRLEGAAASESVVAGGDVDGDGVGDVLVGWPGEVSLFVGPVAADAAPTLTLTGDPVAFGSRVAFADLDGGGDELVVAESTTDGQFVDRVLVYEASSGAPMSTLTGAQGAASTGMDLVALPGVGLVIGSYATDSVWVVPADEALSGGSLDDLGTRIDGPANSSFGFALASADVDGDGDPELYVGAYGYDSGEQTSVGAVFVYELGFSGVHGAEVYASGSANAAVGVAVEAIPDVDGDGSDEIAIGAEGTDYAAFVLFDRLPGSWVYLDDRRSSSAVYVGRLGSRGDEIPGASFGLLGDALLVGDPELVDSAGYGTGGAWLLTDWLEQH